LAFTFGYFPQRESICRTGFLSAQPVTPNYKQRDFVLTVRDNYEFAGGLLQSSISLSISMRMFGAKVFWTNADPAVETGNYFATQSAAQRTELLEVINCQPSDSGKVHTKSKPGLTSTASAAAQLRCAPGKHCPGDGTLAERIVFHRLIRFRRTIENTWASFRIAGCAFQI